MNWGDSESAAAPEGVQASSRPCPDPLRRRVMSALASLVDKHRRVLEDHDQVVITVYLDWRKGKLRETVMALPGGRRELAGE